MMISAQTGSEIFEGLKIGNDNRKYFFHPAENQLETRRVNFFET